jgi:membrane associated rhomboid family serine protease
MTWSIILANCYVFYLELSAGNPPAVQQFINRFAVYSKPLWADFQGNWIRLITAAFLHGGWLHILFNMLFLYIFGDNVEDQMGHIKYLVFYLSACVIANLVQAYMTPQSMIPMIGASGAIAGVLGAYFFFYPHAKVLTLIPLGFFITIREVPAFLFLGFWFLLQTFNGAMTVTAGLITHQTVGGVAWWAHAGGFVSGILLAPVLGKRMGKFR